MKVDHQTLRDLEVLPDASSAATLVDRLDRTITRGGRNALSRRLRSPLMALEEVHEVQEAVRFLTDEHRGALRLPDEREIAAVARYVESNLATLRSLRGPRSWWEVVGVRVRYPEHYEAAIKGSGLIRSEDNLWEGVSYFQAEARRVRNILDEVAGGGSCLVIVDELFRGTNVKDAFDATTAVLRGFAKVRDSRFLVASHLTEVAGELKDLRCVLLRHFEASSVNGKVEFSYRISSGLSMQRLGMEVLRREGVLEALKALDPADETDRAR